MVAPERIEAVKRLYPLLYFACHRHHGRRDHLTERDLRILHHVGYGDPAFATGLARHLGVSRSTMSAALASLEAGGLVERTESPSRRKAIRLTEAGSEAIRSDDGLDGDSIAAVLDELDEPSQRRVVEGLELIARAIERRGV
jgi:DNA-binding MarR family transcriptional regulator